MELGTILHQFTIFFVILLPIPANVIHCILFIGSVQNWCALSEKVSDPIIETQWVLQLNCFSLETEKKIKIKYSIQHKSLIA